VSRKTVYREVARGELRALHVGVSCGSTRRTSASTSSGAFDDVMSLFSVPAGCRAGLFVRGKLDIATSENARDVWELAKNSVVSLSFGYLATDKEMRTEGVQELRQCRHPHPQLQVGRPAPPRDRAGSPTPGADRRGGAPARPCLWSAKRSARPASCGASATACASKRRSGGTPT
jgi:hypothetical protein